MIFGHNFSKRNKIYLIINAKDKCTEIHRKLGLGALCDDVDDDDDGVDDDDGFVSLILTCFLLLSLSIVCFVQVDIIFMRFTYTHAKCLHSGTYIYKHTYTHTHTVKFSQILSSLENP